MKFVECNLIANEQNIKSLDLFSNIDNKRYRYEEIEYVINAEIIDEKVFWLYVKYGKEKPYSHEILDTTTREFGENPKHPNQIELKDQLFCAYVLSNQVLYMSDFRKQNFLSSYLRNEFKRDFVIKKYFINAEDFVSEITSVKEIRFVTKKNLFSQEGIFGDVEDVLGYGTVASLELKAKLERRSIFDATKCLNLIQSFKRRKENGEINKMQCVGKDDNGVEKIFNLETYLKKIEINIDRDKNGMFCNETLKELFCNKLDEVTNGR